MDKQISHVIVEVAKFGKKRQQIRSDLDKLIYLMKNLETIKGVDQLPKFLTEDWIEEAMNKLDKSQMTSEQRMNYEMMMAKNASIIEILKDKEREKISKEAEKRGEKKGEKRGEKRKALETAKKLKDLAIETEIIVQATGLTIEEIEQL